jgi:type VI protein secretion system component Hcp
VATGTHLPTVTLQDGAALITLTNVLVSSLSMGDSSDKKTSQTEHLTFNFQKFTYQVNGVSVTWDIAQNQAQ